MTIKSTRFVDPQGRVVLPNHIRKELNLQPGNTVYVNLDDDGTIRITVAKERCSLCGESVEGQHPTDVPIGRSKKKICYNCAQSVARAMMK